MSLSENIKRLRLEKNLTQEQLAVALGISAQAVSKWENSETYPDGAILVPLANKLGVSLDELFGNRSVFMSDISRRIITLLHNADGSERFHLARDICWQIERGLFNCRSVLEEKYDPDEIWNLQNASYILEDNGFTLVSNGKEPFFSIFLSSEDGFGDFLNEKEDLQKIFKALSRTDTVNALVWLYHKNENYIFESAFLSKVCDIPSEKMNTVLDDLLLLRVIRKRELAVNGQKRTLYDSGPNQNVIALFLIARQFGYQGAYSLQSHYKAVPFFKESCPMKG